MYSTKKLNPLWIKDIVHYMCEYRIWTKSDEELIDIFISMNRSFLFSGGYIK